jgi:hypothetical protein
VLHLGEHLKGGCSQDLSLGGYWQLSNEGAPGREAPPLHAVLKAQESGDAGNPDAEATGSYSTAPQVHILTAHTCTQGS